MGSTSLGLHRWPILAYQRVNLPQRSTQLLPKFYSLSSERCRRGGVGFRACSSKLKKSIRGCATNAFVVADDEKYGNKQNISITPRLYDYILANVREPEVIELTLWFSLSWFPTKILSLGSYIFQFLPLYFLVGYLLEGRFYFRFFDNLGRRLPLCVVARCRYLLLNPFMPNSEWKI